VNRAFHRIIPLVASVALALLVSSGKAEAQLGNLLKKKLSQATAGPMAGQPVKFDKVTLEITADRINSLIAGKRAAKQIADGPTGPAALEAKANQLDARQTAIYDKQVDNINKLDEKRRDWENCRDSAFSALHDLARNRVPDPQTLQQVMQLGQAMAAAQQRGDTAEARRIIAALDKTKAPTRADTLAAEKACGPLPAQSAIIKEWYDLKAQLDTLVKLRSAAEDSVRVTEQRISGMDARQSAVFCERIKAYIAQLKSKQNQYPFTDDEIKTMANLAQAIKDLEALCP
jgi:hypothetical protein